MQTSVAAGQLNAFPYIIILLTCNLSDINTIAHVNIDN